MKYFSTNICSALWARLNRIRSADDIRINCVLSISSLSFISGIVGLNCIDIVLNTITFGRSEINYTYWVVVVIQ